MNKYISDRFLVVYVVSIVLSIALGLLVILGMNHTAYQLVLNFWGSNDLASHSTTVFAPANRVVWEIQARWFLFVLLLIGLIVDALFLNSKTSKKKVKEEVSTKFRSLDFGLTSGLIILIVAILSGVQDIPVLLIIWALVLLASLTFAHALKLKSIKDSKNLVLISNLIRLLPWLVIAVYACSTIVYGMVRSPWYVYVVYLIGLFDLGLIFYLSSLINNRNKNQRDDIEILIYNRLFKAVFVVVLVIGLLK